MLVYPIYLDGPMMTAFLASLEGGVVEETDVERSAGDTKEKSGKASLSVSVSGLLSGILGGGAEGEFAKKVSENVESHYKSTVRFPAAALFIRLRDSLIKHNLVRVVDSKDELAKVCVGDLVEFQGLAAANPAYQIRRAFGQILPILEPYQNFTVAQLDQVLANAKSVKPGPDVVIKVGGVNIPCQDRNQLNDIRKRIEVQKEKAKSESALYQAIGKVLAGLFPEESMDTLLFKAGGFQAVCRVYPAFARDERIQDIHDARWHCLGKVIGTVRESEEYDLLKGSPIGYLAKDQFPALASTLNNDKLNIGVTESAVSGPAVIVATLAIFA